MHKIIINHNPVAKCRHRMTVVHGVAHAYDSQKEKKDETVQSMNRSVFDVSEEILAYPAYSVKFLFEFVFPKYRVKKNMPPVDTIAHVSKPDLDNLVKFYLDCGNGIIWSDDKKIVELQALKCYSSVGRVSIRVEKI